MKIIGEMFDIDVALLPIGGFYTMDARHASKAVEFLRPKRVIPMHYNTWPPIEADPEEFARLVGASCDAKVDIIAPGEDITL